MAEVWTNCISFLASSFGCKKEHDDDNSGQEVLHVTMDIPNLEFSNEEHPTRSEKSENHPLFTAIASKNFADLEQILATTPEANVFRDEDGYTALHRVITVAEDWEQSATAVKMLLEKGCDPNMPTDNHSRRAPLQLVLCNERFSTRSFAILMLLLEQDGIIVDSCDKFMNTALKLAAEKGLLEAVKILTSKEADVNRTDNCGNTPLYYAAKKNHLKEARLLLKSKVDSTHQNKDFETALHVAVVSKNPKMVALLLTYGNQEALTKKNKNGETPLAVAKMQEPDPDVKKIIEMLTNPDLVRPPILDEQRNDVEADYGGASSQVHRPAGRLWCLAKMPSDPTTVFNVTVHGGAVALGNNPTANVYGHNPAAGSLDLPEYVDNNSTERLFSLEHLVADGSANSSDQMESTLSQSQKGNQGKTTTYQVEVKGSSGPLAVGDNSFIAVSPTQEQLPGIYGRTVPSNDQGTGGDQRGDSTSKPDCQVTSVPKIARVALKKGKNTNP